MKNNTIYKFILTILLLASVVGLMFYISDSMLKKIELIKVQSFKDLTAGSFEFGSDIRLAMEKIQSSKVVIENSFISSNQVLDFIRSLEESGQGNGLEITIEKVERGANEKLTVGNQSTSLATFTIQVKGPYDSVMTYTDALLKNQKKLSMTHISFYRNETEAGIEYTARMRLNGIILSYE